MKDDGVAKEGDFVNNKMEEIDKAASYFVEFLKPAYDKSYEITNESPSLSDVLNDEESAVEYLKIVADNRKRLDASNEELEILKKEFEILKAGFDGFDLKAMDNKIKKHLDK